MIDTSEKDFEAKVDQTSPLGCGLEGVLQYRRDVLTGILNGIDEAEWNPAADRHLPVKYDVKTAGVGKAACKAALQKELGLPQVAAAPLVSSVGRLDDQKGFDLIAEVIQRGAHQRRAMGHFGHRTA